MLRSVNALLFAVSLIGCTTDTPDSDTEADTTPPPTWNRLRPRLDDAIAPVRGVVPSRVITHLHSPWSHDACDSEGYVDGVIDTACLADLRRGLCEAGIDLAFMTDHPAHAAEQPYEELWHPQPGDDSVFLGDTAVGGFVPCDDGSQTAWLPGFEDELMPLGMQEHLPGDRAEREAAYNRSDIPTLQAMTDAGAMVFVAHTEQRALEPLRVQRESGLVGVEIFNAHAMFAPNIREEFLGLDGLGWLDAIGPFTRPDGTAEPDLLLMGVLDLQGPSIATFDALLADGPVVGIAGTDAHQNVLGLELRDGERLDSYRRALSWFSNYVYADDTTPAGIRAALGAGRSAVVFEVLGVPDGFDLYVEGDAGTAEMGSDFSGAGELVLDCPTVASSFPQGPDAPEITAIVLKDGNAWASGCGRHTLDGPGVYRAQVNIVPHHLTPFLGDSAADFLHLYPWILSNAIRVDMEG